MNIHNYKLIILIKKILEKMGYKIVSTKRANKSNIENLVRDSVINLLSICNVDLVIDVGAHIGQYGNELRKYGYKKKIISFEPTKSTYKILEENISKDLLWKAYNYALSDINSKEKFYIHRVSGLTNSLSKQTLQMTEFYGVKTEEKFETVEVRRLDGLLEKITKVDENKNIFLKIDAEGFDKKVIKGSINILKKIVGIQIEATISLQRYEEESFFKDMESYLSSLGYSLFSLYPLLSNPVTGQLILIDACFINKSVLPADLNIKNENNKKGLSKIY